MSAEPYPQDILIKQHYDALVIGAGHNGLVSAAYLAQAGLKVLVVERRPLVGGAAATEQVFPGERFNTGTLDAGLFLQQVVADLKLENDGIKFLESPVVVYAPQVDGRAVTLWRDRQRAAREIAAFSAHDAQAYPHFLEWLDRLTGLLEAIRTLTPPSLPQYRLGELAPWLRVGLKVRRLGDREMMEFLRVLPLSVKEFLDAWFENPALKAALGFTGCAGSMQGPYASGTAFNMLYHAIGAGEAGFRASRFVQGGAGALSEALAQSARNFGAEVCTSVGVKSILIKDNQAVGALLEDGRRIKARLVVSSADPRHTFFDLLGASHLPVRFTRQVKNIKFRGSTARVNLVLDALPQFTSLDNLSSPEDIRSVLSGHILLCPDLDSLERAYDEAKYGRISRQPCLDLVIPTLLDSSLSSQGRHLMSVDVRYAPYHLKDQTWEQAGTSLVERVIAAVEVYAPGFEDSILERQVITPQVYESEYGLAEGSLYHGQMGLDQLLFMRPVAGHGRYRTPINNLFLCGSGAHPGGGLTGAPGYNAAREILRSLRGG
jgi:phytoene dehydrogenase-like protein